MKRTMVAVLTAALLTACIVPGLASAETVTLTAHVNESVVVTQMDGAARIQANTDWHLVVETAEGILDVTGGPTSGQTVELPESTTAYWLVSK